MSPPHSTGRRSGGRPDSAEANLAVELDVELQAGDLEGHRRRESRAAPGRPGSDRLRRGLLDFALRADADHLEELADAEVEGLFVHGDLLGPVNATAPAGFAAPGPCEARPEAMLAPCMKTAIDEGPLGVDPARIRGERTCRTFSCPCL